MRPFTLAKSTLEPARPERVEAGRMTLLVYALAALMVYSAVMWVADLYPRLTQGRIWANYDDLVTFYFAAKAYWLHLGNPYVPEEVRVLGQGWFPPGYTNPFLYNPAGLLVLSVLVPWPIEVVYTAVFIINLACAGWVAWLIYRRWDAGGQGRLGALLGFALAFGFYSTSNYFLGTFGFMYGAVVAWFWVGLGRDKAPSLMGLVVCWLLLACKPQLLLLGLIPALRPRHWPTLAASVAILVSIVGVHYLIDPGIYQAYFTFLSGGNFDNNLAPFGVPVTYISNQSFYAALMRLRYIATYATGRPWIDAALIIKALLAAHGGACLVGWWWLVRYRRQAAHQAAAGSPVEAWFASGLLMGLFLFYYISWHTYLAFVLVPLLLAAPGLANGRISRRLSGALWLAVGLITIASLMRWLSVEFADTKSMRVLLSWAVGQQPLTWMMAVLYGICVYGVAKDKEYRKEGVEY